MKSHEPTELPVSARNKLRAAIATADACRIAVERAEEIADRAKADLERATAALSEFDALDASLAAARIQALRSGKWSGYPTELLDAQKGKLSAQEELRHATAAASQLDAELADAHDLLTAADREVEEAKAAVFLDAVGGVLAKLEELNRQRELLRRLLRGAALPFGAMGLFERIRPEQRRLLIESAVRAAGLPLGNVEGWTGLHGSVEAALSLPALPDSQEADATAREYWRKFAKELASDPNVQPGALPDRDAILI